MQRASQARPPPPTSHTQAEEAMEQTGEVRRGEENRERRGGEERKKRKGERERRRERMEQRTP